VGVVAAWFAPPERGRSHLKHDDSLSSAKNAREGSPMRTHAEAYDEVYALALKVEQSGSDLPTIERLLVLSRYTAYEMVRVFACSALGMSKNPPEQRDRIVARLVECLRDPEGAVQLTACFALAEQDAKHKASDIVPLLDSRNENVRKAAKRSLEKLGVAVPTVAQPKS
jgi:hypothetical protein